MLGDGFAQSPLVPPGGGIYRPFDGCVENRCCGRMPFGFVNTHKHKVAKSGCGRMVVVVRKPLIAGKLENEPADRGCGEAGE